MRACQPKDLKGREWRSLWERERKREKEKEKEHTHVGEKERESTRTRERREREREQARTKERKRECFGSSFYIFLPLPGPALCKLGLARSAVLST